MTVDDYLLPHLLLHCDEVVSNLCKSGVSEGDAEKGGCLSNKLEQPTWKDSNCKNVKDGPNLPMVVSLEVSRMK